MRNTLSSCCEWLRPTWTHKLPVRKVSFSPFFYPCGLVTSRAQLEERGCQTCSCTNRNLTTFWITMSQWLSNFIWIVLSVAKRIFFFFFFSECSLHLETLNSNCVDVLFAETRRLITSPSLRNQTKIIAGWHINNSTNVLSCSANWGLCRVTTPQQNLRGVLKYI